MEIIRASELWFEDIQIATVFPESEILSTLWRELSWSHIKTIKKLLLFERIAASKGRNR
jgi:hypothetical protein